MKSRAAACSGLLQGFPFLLRWVLSTLLLILMSFILLRLLPGSPFDDDIKLHPLVRDQLEAAWGLHGNVFHQFFLYLASVLKFELGYSLQNPGESVASMISARWLHTWKLNFIALVGVMALSGLWALLAFYSESMKQGILKLHQLILSLPTLFSAPFLLFVFSFSMGWLPYAFLETNRSYILPVLVLILRPAVILSQIQIRQQDEVMRQNFIQVAKAKGLSLSRIYFLHVCKNTLPVSLAYFPDVAVGLLSGSFLVEVLFSVPGVGTLFVQSLSERDYPLVVGITLVFGMCFVFLSQAVGYLNEILDPRRRLA